MSKEKEPKGFAKWRRVHIKSKTGSKKPIELPFGEYKFTIMSKKKAAKKNYKEENLWNYLKAKLFVRGIDDNNLTARQLYNYITKHFKAKRV